MKRLLFIMVFAFIIFSINGYAYNITAAGHWCHNCTDCEDAINNNTHILNTTYLNRSITDWNDDCIDNPENFTNVTFDCQGYTIDSDWTTNKDGIRNIEKNGNIIRNCIITGFSSDGILLTSSNTQLINNTLYGNRYGVTLYTGVNNTLINNSMYDNTDFNLWTEKLDITSNHTIDTTNNVSSRPVYFYYNQSGLTFDGSINITNHITVLKSTNVTITGVSATEGDPILLLYSNDVTVQNSMINYSSDNIGIYMKYTNDSFIINNDNINATIYSIEDKYGINNTIENNTITGASSGIYLTDSENLTIFNNTINMPGGQAISFTIGSLRNNVTNNTFLLTDRAILIKGSSNYNNIVNNTIRYTVYNGIYIESGSNNLIARNTFDFIGWDAIYFASMYGGTTTVEYNTINNTGRYGINFEMINSNNILRNNTIINTTNNVIRMTFWSFNTLYNMSIGKNSSSLVNFSAAVTDVSFDPASTVAATPTGYVSLNSYINIIGEAAGAADISSLNLSYDSTNVVGNNIGIYKYVAPDWVNISNDALYEDDNYVSVVFTPAVATITYGIFEDPPPLRSGGSPTGTITIDSTILYLETSENATCRYSDASGTAYTAMTSANTDWGTSHSWSLTSLITGDYNYYIRCNDTAGNYNANDYPINFTVSIPRPYTTGGFPPAPSEESPTDTVPGGGQETNEQDNQEESTGEPEQDIFDILPKEITLPLITQFGAPITIIQISLVSITNYMAGREIIFIDVFPIFDLLGLKGFTFDYINPIIKIR